MKTSRGGVTRRAHGLRYSRIHGHGGESRVDVLAGRVGRVACERLGWVELVLATELVWRQAVVLPYFVQVGLGSNQHARRLAVDEVLLQSRAG